MLMSSFSSTGWNSWVRDWTEVSRFALGFPAGIPKSLRNGLVGVRLELVWLSSPDGDWSGVMKLLLAGFVVVVI